MSYRIEYNNSPSRNPLYTVLFTCVFFFLFCTAVALLWPEGRALLQELLLPGANAVTQKAIAVFFQELRFGEPLPEAAEHFCREILRYETFG